MRAAATVRASFAFIGLALASGALLAGCEGAIPMPEVTVTDSAGVEVVTNTQVVRGPGVLRLTRRPLLRTGWKDEEPWFQRLTSAHRLEDGRLMVADGTSGRITVLSRDGIVLQEMGGRGDGPGEFAGLGQLFVGRDSIYAFDDRVGRLSVFFEGRLRRQVRFEPWREGYRPVGLLAGGRFVLHRPSWTSVPGVGARWDDAPVILVSGGGAPLDTLTLAPRPRDAPPGRSAPWAVWAQVAADGAGIVYNRTDLPEVRWFGADGRLRRVARMDIAPGDSVPLFNRMHVDPQGSVWLGEAVSAWSAPSRYFVVSPEGRWLGAVALPDDFEVLAVREDEVIGLQLDRAEVAALAVFGLERR